MDKNFKFKRNKMKGKCRKKNKRNKRNKINLWKDRSLKLQIATKGKKKMLRRKMKPKKRAFTKIIR